MGSSAQCFEFGRMGSSAQCFEFGRMVSSAKYFDFGRMVSSAKYFDFGRMGSSANFAFGRMGPKCIWENRIVGGLKIFVTRIFLSNQPAFKLKLMD